MNPHMIPKQCKGIYQNADLESKMNATLCTLLAMPDMSTGHLAFCCCMVNRAVSFSFQLTIQVLVQIIDRHTPRPFCAQDPSELLPVKGDNSSLNGPIVHLVIKWDRICESGLV
uniref:Uncharacterized protein n=1 Tax=Sphaerodactylus townsendi TaxID=933632 RepID=A0ACB8G9I1_9SAUR